MRNRGPRPPWWPDGEPWPPQRPPWQVHRRKFLIAVAIVILAIVIVVAASTLTGLELADRIREQRDDGGGPPPWIIFPILFWILVISTIVRLVRRFTRSVSPIFEVMEATSRVAAGDYAVRVAEPKEPESRRLVASFNIMAERLEANDQQRRRLFADIAHELRTPLSVIQGTVEGMIDGIYPRDDAHLEPLVRESHLIARLLEDLHLLSRAEAGVLHLDREPADLRAFLTGIVTAWAPRAAQERVSLHGPGPGESVVVSMDGNRMRQVIENLLSNALRHTPHGGTIGIQLAAKPEMATIAITDTGPGIPDDLLPQIFERFVKSADSGGTGLGLAIARRLTEAHGGTITAASPPDGGTTITLTLPR
jgi:two-component system sensor histidine kinase BaeS